MTRKLLRFFGELLVIAGALMLLYLAYSLWFSNVTAEATAKSISQQLEQEFDLHDAGVQLTSTSEVVTQSETPAYKLKALGLVYIPALKSKVWGLPLIEGVDKRALASGIGHYKSTALPGESGNFAIAAHRATHGEPFAYFEKLKAGDLVYVRTKDAWYEYKLVADKKVRESETWVLSDQPKGLTVEAGESIITLTTCDPRWNSYQRWVRWGLLQQVYPTTNPPFDPKAR